MKKYLVTIIILGMGVGTFFLFNQRGSWVEINGRRFSVEVARTDIEHALGFMNRPSVPMDHGMIFVFEDEDIRRFWMKNTLIPLDMVFIDEDLRIVDIQRAIPCVSDPCVSYISKEPAKYVLEVNGGILSSEQGTVNNVVSLKLIDEK